MGELRASRNQPSAWDQSSCLKASTPISWHVSGSLHHVNCGFGKCMPHTALGQGAGT